MRRSDVDMIHGPLLKNVLVYTIPIILTSLLQLLFNAADLIIVSRYSEIKSIAMAAVSATGSITTLIVNMFIGLSVGGGVRVAHAYGAQDSEEAHKTVHTAILFAVLSGIFVTFVGMTFCETFLTWMGTPDTVLPLSATYMRFYFAGAISMMVYNFGASILRAVGDSKRPLYFLAIAGVLNVLLNLIFVIVFKMDVDGVALATTISQTVSAALVVLALMHRDDACRLFIKDLRIHKEQFLKMLKIGIPAGIQGSIFSISNVIIQSSINSFGDIAMRGNGAASNIEGFVWNIMNAFQQTALNFIGQNMGAKNYGRLRKIMWTCLGCVTVAGLVFGNAAYLAGDKLLGIYITDMPEAIPYGLLRMSFLAAPYFLCGTMDVMTGALRGAGRSVSAMVITIAGVVGIRIVWIFTIFQIPQFHTLRSLYFSYPISWAVTLIIEFVYFMVVTGKLKKQNALGAVVE
ncbi:MAG: MATE family efflux transporter [Clostridia bacterium]|nr:MATE family efflux transporter [Clostridia bacterium]